MSVQVRATLANPGAAKRAIDRSLGAIVRHRAEDAGREMVRLANAKMANLFDLNRPGSRRRYPGTTRAANALDYRVEGHELPIRVQYRVLGGEQVRLRILGLNYGTPPHDIRPSGTWSLRGQTPTPVRSRQRQGRPKIAWLDGEWTVVDDVSHPGTGATHFLEEARDEAAAKYLTN